MKLWWYYSFFCYILCISFCYFINHSYYQIMAFVNLLESNNSWSIGALIIGTNAIFPNMSLLSKTLNFFKLNSRNNSVLLWLDCCCLSLCIVFDYTVPFWRCCLFDAVRCCDAVFIQFSYPQEPAVNVISLLKVHRFIR